MVGLPGEVALFQASQHYHPVLEKRSGSSKGGPQLYLRLNHPSPRGQYSLFHLGAWMWTLTEESVAIRALPFSGWGLSQEGVHLWIIKPEGTSLVTHPFDIHPSEFLPNGDHRDYLDELLFKLQHEKGKNKIPWRCLMMQRLSHLFDQLLCERGFISRLSMCGYNCQQSLTPAVQAGQSSPPLVASAPHTGTSRWWLHHHVTPPWRVTDQAQAHSASDKYQDKDFSDWEQAGTTVASKRERLDSHQPGPTRAGLSLLHDKRFVPSKVCTTGWRWAGGRRPLSFTALLLWDDNSDCSTDRISDLAGAPSKTGMGQENPCIAPQCWQGAGGAMRVWQGQSYTATVAGEDVPVEAWALWVGFCLWFPICSEVIPFSEELGIGSFKLSQRM